MFGAADNARGIICSLRERVRSKTDTARPHFHTQRHLSLALLFPVALCPALHRSPSLARSLALLTRRIIAFFILLLEQQIYKLRYNAAPVELVALAQCRHSATVACFACFSYVIYTSRRNKGRSMRWCWGRK